MVSSISFPTTSSVLVRPASAGSHDSGSGPTVFARTRDSRRSSRHASGDRSSLATRPSMIASAPMESLDTIRRPGRGRVGGARGGALLRVGWRLDGFRCRPGGPTGSGPTNGDRSPATPAPTPSAPYTGPGWLVLVGPFQRRGLCDHRTVCGRGPAALVQDRGTGMACGWGGISGPVVLTRSRAGAASWSGDGPGHAHLGRRRRGHGAAEYSSPVGVRAWGRPTGSPP